MPILKPFQMRKRQRLKGSFSFWTNSVQETPSTTNLPWSWMACQSHNWSNKGGTSCTAFASSPTPCEMAFGIPRNSQENPRNSQEFIPRNKGVNFHGKFGLGIPRNSQEFPTITTLVLKTQKFPEIHLLGFRFHVQYHVIFDINKPRKFGHRVELAAHVSNLRLWKFFLNNFPLSRSVSSLKIDIFLLAFI